MHHWKDPPENSQPCNAGIGSFTTNKPSFFLFSCPCFALLQGGSGGITVCGRWLLQFLHNSDSNRPHSDLHIAAFQPQALEVAGQWQWFQRWCKRCRHGDSFRRPLRAGKMASADAVCCGITCSHQMHENRDDQVHYFWNFIHQLSVTEMKWTDK